MFKIVVVKLWTISSVLIRYQTAPAVGQAALESLLQTTVKAVVLFPEQCYHQIR